MLLKDDPFEPTTHRAGQRVLRLIYVQCSCVLLVLIDATLEDP